MLDKRVALFLLLCVGSVAGGCLNTDQQAASYNNLVWNRENAAAGNGETDTGPWFEWWYYKVILPDTGEAFYFVYGVVNPWDTSSTDPASYAYVGFGNFAEQEQVRETYPVADFSSTYDRTEVQIGEQRATDTAISGALSENGHTVSWDISITPSWSFNAMGWAMFVPELTNIYWYPAQAAASFSGVIVCDGREYILRDVPGYQDRNWGRTFPAWWAWITANHFDGYPNTALAAGGGQPTILDRIDCVEGLAVGLRHRGKEYAFRPGDGDCERITVDFGTWNVVAVNRDGYKIEVEASAPCESFMDLVFATPGGDLFHDYETLTGTLTVRLYEWDICRYRLLETLSSDFAGIEYGAADALLGDCHDKGLRVLYDNFK